MIESQGRGTTPRKTYRPIEFIYELVDGTVVVYCMTMRVIKMLERIDTRTHNSNILHLITVAVRGKH